MILRDEPPPDEQVFDAVIVGGGVAGAVVARALRAAGRSVLLLEAGTAVAATDDGYRSLVERMQGALFKTPESPFPDNPNAASPSVLDRIGWKDGRDVGRFVQRGPLPFSSNYTRALGGSTLHWLGSCPRMRPADLRTRSSFGRGVDWPLEYESLLPLYARAESELGVAGDRDEQAAIGIPMPADYAYPMRRVPASFVDRFFAEGLSAGPLAVDGAACDARVTVTPQARNATPDSRFAPPFGRRPVGEPSEPYRGERCAGNASCVPLCPIQARYTALRTLRAARGVEVLAQAVAERVEFDPASGVVRAVRYRRYHRPDAPEATRHRAVGRCFVLAANAVENAVLLLASGAAPRSGLVGRGLMDHPFVLSWGLAPRPLGPFRGPSSTAGLEGFCDGAFRARHAAFRVEIGNWGWDMVTGAPVGEVLDAVDQGLFGAALRARLRATLRHQVRLGALVEQPPDDANRVAIDHAKRDALGLHRPVIHYDLCEYTRAGVAASRRLARAVFARLGVVDATRYDPGSAGYFTHAGEGYSFYGGGHLAGTHRMGATPRDGVVDADQRAWDHANLYVVGAGSMPTMGAANPTLTLAALAFRTADRIAQELA